VTTLFSTHPSTAERVQRLERVAVTTQVLTGKQPPYEIRRHLNLGGCR